MNVSCSSFIELSSRIHFLDSIISEDDYLSRKRKTEDLLRVMFSLSFPYIHCFLQIKINNKENVFSNRIFYFSPPTNKRKYNSTIFDYVLWHEPVIISFQQNILIQSIFLPIENADGQMSRSFEAPLSAPSLFPAALNDNQRYMGNMDSSASISSDEDIIRFINKRRQRMPLFGRRATPNKRRGPLFG